MPECSILLRSISSVLSRVLVSGLWNLVMIISSCTLLWILCPLKNQSTSSGACRTPVALHESRMASPWSTNSAPDKVIAETRTETQAQLPLCSIRLLFCLITCNTWRMCSPHASNKINLFYLQSATKHISHLITSMNYKYMLYQNICVPNELDHTYIK